MKGCQNAKKVKTIIIIVMSWSQRGNGKWNNKKKEHYFITIVCERSLKNRA